MSEQTDAAYWVGWYKTEVEIAERNLATAIKSHDEAMRRFVELNRLER